jgi:peptidoglycan/LPS O-acetylase OafA/YrhL
MGFSGWYVELIPWAILAAVALLLTSSPPSAIQPYFDFVTVVAVYPAIIYVALHFQPTGASARICKFFGAISYAVYAIHCPLGVLVQDLLRSVGGILVENYAPWAGFAFIAVLIPLCWMLDQIYDAPIRRWLIGSRPTKSVVLAETPKY